MDNELHEALLQIVDYARDAAETERARVDKFDREDDFLIPSWLPELEKAISEYDEVNNQ